MACCRGGGGNVLERTISIAEAKQAAYPEAYTAEAEIIVQAMQQPSDAHQSLAALPWDQAPPKPGASGIQPVAQQAASEPERRRSGILTAISMLPESAAERRSSQGAEGIEAESPSDAGMGSAKGLLTSGEQGQQQLLGDVSGLGEADEMLGAEEVEAGGSATSEPALPSDLSASRGQAPDRRAEDASESGAEDYASESGEEVQPSLRDLEPYQVATGMEPHSLAAHRSLSMEGKSLSAGVRPQSAKAHHPSKTAHELYLQTLHEARSQAMRPQSAPRQPRLGAMPQSAMSEPMQAITELLREAQASALQGERPVAPLLSPEQRLKEEVRQQLLVPVMGWGLAEVGRWVAVIGLPQYRKRFIHQGITGPLLLKLNHAVLKVDLGIGVLGHRETLLSAIRGLPAAHQADAEELWHHQAAPDSPESPILKAKLHRQKLLRELEKAQAHSAALQSKMEGTAHQAELVEGDVMHIRGAILDLERQFRLPSSLGGTEQGQAGSGLDKQGIVPWHPNGAPFELTIPTIEKASAERESLSPKKAGPSPHSAHTGHLPSFLDRMGMDLQERKRRLKAQKHILYSPERLFQDPNYSTKLRKADMATISRSLQKMLGARLSDLTSGRTPLTSLHSPQERVSHSGASPATEDTTADGTAVAAEKRTWETADVPTGGDSHDSQLVTGLQPPLLDGSAATEPAAVRSDDEDADAYGEISCDTKQPRSQEETAVLGRENSAETQSAGGEQPSKASLSHSKTAREALPPIAEAEDGPKRREVVPQSLAAVLDYLAGCIPQQIGLTDTQAKSLLAAKAEDRKVQQLAGIFREARFMERYENEAQARQQRRQQLAKHWHSVETQPPKPPEGRQLRYWKAPVTQKERDENELDLCRVLFSRAGWPLADFTSGGGRGADEKLNAVLTRAEAVATGAALKKSQGIRQALPDFEDGLDEVQAIYLERMADSQGKTAGGGGEQAVEDAPLDFLPDRTSGSLAAHSATQRTLSTSSSTYFAEAQPHATGEHQTSKTQAGKGGEALTQDTAAVREARGQQALSQTLPKGKAQEDVLGSVPGQLARCRPDELARLKACKGPRKQLAVYRALVTQRFLQDIKEDKKKRAEKTMALLKATEGGNKRLTKEEADAFFVRLQTDAERRRKAREEAIKVAEEQQLAAMEAARKRLAESLAQGRPKSGGGRPASAVVRPASAAPAGIMRPASARP